MNIASLQRLYSNEKLSTREVGEILGVSQWSVVAAMRKHNIPRRKTTETLKIQFDKSPLSFKRKDTLTPAEQDLFSAGLMVYWAEGAKANHGIVDFANSNERMVLLFLRMLREIYQVQDNRLRVLLYCYANQKPALLLNFWSELLKIPLQQFTKPYIRSDFKSSKIDKMPHGLIHIRYNDKRLLKQILEDIDIIASDLVNC